MEKTTSIEKLSKEVKEIKREVELLKKRVFITDDSLIKFWDNEYDEQWNGC